MRLYKYRGFTNIEFALDIFVHQRLYAANFKRLNDPMEGRFVYSRGSLNREELAEIRGNKAAYNVLSLSETERNMLMWSYYAEGHSGFVVGVDVADSRAIVEPVTYVDDLQLDTTDGDIARQVLTKKLRLWEHEKEHRVLIRGDHFVSVDVKQLIFGLESDGTKKDLLTKIATKFCPSIEVTTISRDQLEKGDVEPYDM